MITISGKSISVPLVSARYLGQDNCVVAGVAVAVVAVVVERAAVNNRERRECGLYVIW